MTWNPSHDHAPQAADERLLRRGSTTPVTVTIPIPLPWYEEKSYEQIRALMADGEHFAAFAAWEIDALRTEAFFAARGEKTQRIYVEPAAFTRWCKANGRKADANGRVAYAAWVARLGGRQEPHL